MSVATVLSLRSSRGARHGDVFQLPLCFSSTNDQGGGNFYWDETSADNDNGGTCFQPWFGLTNALPTGRWKRIYSGPFNVSWFGAKFDCESATLLQRTNGSNVVGAPVGTFDAGDVGKTMAMANATAVLTGTVSTTLGLTTMTGAGTLFLTELADSTHFWINDSQYYAISKINSNTSLELTTGAVANAVAQPYRGNAALVSTITAVASNGSSCTLAASGASVHFTLGNTRGCWGTDDSAAFAAADAAAPDGVSVLMPAGQSMLPSGFTTSKRHVFIGVGTAAQNAVERGNDEWFRVSNSSGTVLYFPGSVGFVVSGTLTLSTGLKDVTLLGSGHFGCVGLTLGSGVDCGAITLDHVHVTNFYQCHLWNNILDAYFYDVFALACKYGIRATNACNDIHVFNCSVQFCELGIDTTNMSSVHFYGALIQDNVLGINFGQGDNIFLHDGWFEANIQSFAVNLLSASITNFGFEKMRCSDTFVMPAPLGGTGIQGFVVRDCHFDGVTLNLANMADVVLEKSRVDTLDVSTPPFGLSMVAMAFTGSSAAITAFAPGAATSTYTYAATVTPDYLRGEVCYVLATGNVVFGAPLNLVPGGRLTLIVLQDGAGGRTVGLNAVFKGTWVPHAGANAVASMTFWVRDATNLLPIGSV